MRPLGIGTRNPDRYTESGRRHLSRDFYTMPEKRVDIGLLSAREAYYKSRRDNTFGASFLANPDNNRRFSSGKHVRRNVVVPTGGIDCLQCPVTVRRADSPRALDRNDGVVRTEAVDRRHGDAVLRTH